MSEKLKLVNCGCGGNPIINKQENGEYEVYCSNCLIRTDSYKTEDKAIKLWNKAMKLNSFDNKWIYSYLLHRELECPLIGCVEAHNKAIEYLRSLCRIKG